MDYSCDTCQDYYGRWWDCEYWTNIVQTKCCLTHDSSRYWKTDKGDHCITEYPKQLLWKCQVQGLCAVVTIDKQTKLIVSYFTQFPVTEGSFSFLLREEELFILRRAHLHLQSQVLIHHCIDCEPAIPIDCEPAIPIDCEPATDDNDSLQRAWFQETTISHE